MSADAIKAWAQVAQEQLTNALEKIHPDERPALDVVVAVGQVMAVGVTARDGFCDMTEGQIYNALKGAYGSRSIKNAVYALRIAGVIASVRGGTVGKDGKGRGAWRVFVDADTKNLIPANYEPPSPRRQSQTGQDLTQNQTESQTGSGYCETGTNQSQTGQDLTTPKESLYLPTAASAQPLVETPKEDASSTAATHPSCRTCEAAAPNSDESLRRLARAAYVAVPSGRQLAHALALTRGKKVAPILRAHYPDANDGQLIPLLAQAINNYKPGAQLHDHVLELAASFFVQPD